MKIMVILLSIVVICLIGGLILYKLAGHHDI
jgi:hypothetical protein